jgi:hypothetical protein
MYVKEATKESTQQLKCGGRKKRTSGDVKRSEWELAGLTSGNNAVVGRVKPDKRNKNNNQEITSARVGLRTQ